MEDKILFQGIMLLITSLFGIISGLGVYVWNSDRHNHDKQVKELKTDVQKLKDSKDNHESRLIFLETEHNMNTCKKRKK